MKRNEKYNIVFHAAVCLLAAFYILVSFYAVYLEKRVSDSANGVPSLLMLVPACVMILNLVLFFPTLKNTPMSAVKTCIIVSLVAFCGATAIGIMYFSTPISWFRAMEIAVFAVFTVNSALVQLTALRYFDAQRKMT